MRLNGDNGVAVAMVEKNIDVHAVRVDSTVVFQHLYADDSTLVISGSNFNEIGNNLRFSNGIMGNNVNYITVSTTSEKIKLRLVPGSLLSKNFEVLLVVNTGERVSWLWATRTGAAQWR